MTHAFKKVTALLLGLTMLGGTFGGAFLAFNDGGTPTRAAEGDVYEKVTSQLDDFTGTYLVVTEMDETTARVFNASLGTSADKASNYVEATISNGTIVADATLSNEEVTLSKDGTGYQMFTSYGGTSAYFYNTGTSNDLKIKTSPDDPLAVSYDTTLNRVSIEATSGGTAKYFVFNNMNNNTRFRFMKNDCAGATGGNDNYLPIQLYKKVEVVPTEPTVTINGPTTGYVGGAATLTSSLEAFTETELEYLWSANAGSEDLVTITNEDTPIATVNFVAAGEANINLIVMGVEEIAEANIIINIQQVNSITVKEAKESNQGSEVYVCGVVFANYGGRRYIADTDGTGMQINNTSLELSIGDEVLLSATLGEYNGVPQLNNVKLLATLSKDNVLQPKVLTFDELTNNELSNYIAIEDAVYVNRASGSNIDMDFSIPNGTGGTTTIQMFGTSSSAGDMAVATLNAASADWEANITTLTLAGPLTQYQGNYQLQFAEGTTYEVNEVETFARKFLAASLCDGGTTAPNSDLWNELATAFAALDTTSQDVFKNADGDESEVVSQAVERYDYILRKYGEDPQHGGYTNFMGRTVAANAGFVGSVFNEDATIVIAVVVIVLAAITALVGFYYVNKRRRVNK